MRTESEPQGKLFEAMLGTAIEAHPYRVPPVGWASDIENLRVCDHLIGVGKIAELAGLRFDPVEGLRIGALTTARETETFSRAIGIELQKTVPELPERLVLEVGRLCWSQGGPIETAKVKAAAPPTTARSATTTTPAAACSRSSTAWPG